MKAKWFWCLHCERCYQLGECRHVGPDLLCPYPGCDGGIILDGWRWSHVRKSVLGRDGVTYPAVPERGVRYALYPP
jgi:hypothetical protein